MGQISQNITILTPTYTILFLRECWAWAVCKSWDIAIHINHHVSHYFKISTFCGICKKRSSMEGRSTSKLTSWRYSQWELVGIWKLWSYWKIWYPSFLTCWNRNGFGVFFLFFVVVLLLMFLFNYRCCMPNSFYT